MFFRITLASEEMSGYFGLGFASPLALFARHGKQGLNCSSHRKDLEILAPSPDGMHSFAAVSAAGTPIPGVASAHGICARLPLRRPGRPS